MAVRRHKYELSMRDRLRRSLYEVLRDQLDISLIKHSLVDSYWRFRRAGESNPFIQKKELKPRARVNKKEYPKQNSFWWTNRMITVCVFSRWSMSVPNLRNPRQIKNPGDCSLFTSGRPLTISLLSLWRNIRMFIRFITKQSTVLINK
jgi:hypothetical protein